MLMFCFHQGCLQSLTDLSCYLKSNCGLSISKQGIHGRFNKEAVAFMEKVLGSVMGEQLKEASRPSFLSMFNRVRIKDSTKFSLPAAFNAVYKGFGGAIAKAKAIISIQFEYDLLSGKTLDMKMTSGCRNDQADSKESLDDIRENDLFIRDLGYVTLDYLKRIILGGAYFLNRAPAKAHIFTDKEGMPLFDFKKVAKKLKKQKLAFMEVRVLLGKGKFDPCRLIVSQVDTKTYEKRLIKAQKHKCFK